MGSQSVHAVAGRVLRHWTIDSRAFVGGSQRPARAHPYSESAEGGLFHRLASALARVKRELPHRVI
jgi:hypothetical protein